MFSRLSNLSTLEPYLESVNSVYFYTPGVAVVDSVVDLKQTLASKFINAKINVESDLLAAAHSVYKGIPLFISILGTGSNIAFYDGEELQQTSPSLGYILGDEGSGASLGKRILKAYLHQSLPKDLYLSFSKSYSISKENVLKSVYTKEAPNRFLASYVPFLLDNKNHEFARNLVKEEFRSYFKIHLLRNNVIHDFPISFVGSVAFLFQDILIELCSQYDITVDSFIQNPLVGLVEYHSKG